MSLSVDFIDLAALERLRDELDALAAEGVARDDERYCSLERRYTRLLGWVVST